MRPMNAASLAALALASGGALANTVSDQRAPQARPPAQDHAILVAPVHVAIDEKLNGGCWARIYENADFGGSQLTIVGPLDLGKLEGTVADDWNGADSLITGGSATVTTYGEPGFRERRSAYAPNHYAHELRSGPLEKVQSLRVTCGA